MQLGARTVGGLISVRLTTGGQGYTAAPTVSFSGGTGITAYCHVNGGAVQNVCIVSPGAGMTANPTVSFTGGGGTGAAAVAFACTTSTPMTFFKGRYADVYGVDGMGRGVRWDGSATAVEPIGLNPPAFGPALTAGTSASGKEVNSVQIVYGGAGYFAAPSVVFTGGTPTRAAKASATVRDGRVVAIKVIDRGAGYQTNPTVSLSGGIGSGATFTVGVLGKVAGVRLTGFGGGYAGTTAPTLSLSTQQGLTDALVNVQVDDYGRIANAIIISAGTGATTTGVTGAISGAGSAAAANIDLAFRLNTITVGNSGSGYYVPPVVTIAPAPGDPSGSGGQAVAAVDAQGRISAVTVVNGGSYSIPPTATIESTVAEAQAELTAAMSGRYQCCIRYLDDTPETQGGPIASSISPLVELDAGSGTNTVTWSLTHAGLDARVSAVELWRTTSEQSVILFRVATIQRSDANFSGTYSDTLSDSQLIDPERDGYALMPITMPSGQINARRFGVPPGEFSVACMFQDRAWYAVDSTGQRPNSLLYSEVDEPESVPDANELVVQENTGESDRVVALVPLGANLLIVQTAHMYRLTYVAQPVIDASMMLVSNRGVLHNRCWAAMGGVVFLVDSQGMYAFDGQNEESLSIAVDNYWRDGSIDFSKAHQFHVAADAQTKTVRFYYCAAADTDTVRALCYCVATKAWWSETYDRAVTATCRVMRAGRVQPLQAQTLANNAAQFSVTAGASDNGTAIPYSLRTGPMTLKTEGGRSVDVLFAPTTASATLGLALHYNNAAAPRPNAIASDRGGAFVTTTGGTLATLNMSKTRSPLGEASGQARAYYSGRVDDRSVGTDRHMAVAVTGSATEPVAVHKIAIDGVG